MTKIDGLDIHFIMCRRVVIGVRVVTDAMGRQAPAGLLGIHINVPATVPADVAKASSRKSRTPPRTCCKTCSERTRAPAAWCMASQAFRSALRSSWKGGAQVILATAPSSKAMSELVDGLGPNGKLMVVGVAAEPIEVTPAQLISGSRSLQGWASGTAADIEDTLAFAELSGVRPMIETYPLEEAAEAYARMLSGKAEFRVVLTMSH